MKINKIIPKTMSYGILVMAPLVTCFPNIASAAYITNRKIVIGDSVANSSTTYDFMFTSESVMAIKSVPFVARTINFVNNLTLATGINMLGFGTGAVKNGYNSSDRFKLVPNTSETTPATAAPTNSNVFTNSYIANMDGATAASVYSTASAYTITSNF